MLASGAYSIKDVILPVKVAQHFSFSNKCLVPKFLSTGKHDTNHLNHNIMRLAYDAIDNGRSHYDDHLQLLDSQLGGRFYGMHIDYAIHLNTENLISLSLNVYHNHSGPYPHIERCHLVYNLDSQNRLMLNDALDYSSFASFDAFLEKTIKTYSENAQQSDILHTYKKDVDPSELDFYVRDAKFVIDFSNILPHVLKAVGELEIPREAVRLKL